MNLNWDIARCTGNGCSKKSECLRHIELKNCSEITALFEPPIDFDVTNGCELIIKECGNCFEGKSDLNHVCKKCGGTGIENNDFNKE